jgi:DNA recombination protein RmuC
MPIDYLIAAVIVIAAVAAAYIITRIESLSGRVEHLSRATKEGLASQREDFQTSARAERDETAKNFSLLGDSQLKGMAEMAALQKDSLDLLSRRLESLTRSNEARLDTMRETVENRLRELQSGNEEKLERMRVLVDEKLHATLEARLGAAFANVSDWLDKVHKGLGEMKNLASDVGDLRKVLTNVKTRGTWGEIQLGALLEQILQRDQYEENVAVRPDSSERVEFAVKLPGADSSGPVWLPIDSKFPQEDYLRIIDASEKVDPEAMASATKALERRVLEESKKIGEKYIEAPYTTDFAVLFVPVEGLFSEILRIDGLAERVMRERRVVITGPTTVAALLNSLQMGFRTLAVERRSSEVWALLGQVKTEFAKFGDVLDKVRKKIEQAGNDLDGAGKRTRAIERKLREVSELPSDSLAQELEHLSYAEDGETDAEE